MSLVDRALPPSRVMVVIPAHNEESTVAAVVREALALGVAVVLVDDASQDATLERAQEAGASVLSLPFQLGAWGATQTGIRHACRQGYSLVVTMDADGQHQAQSIPRLLEPILAGGADVSIGSFTQRGSLARRLAWRFFRWLTGLEIADLTSGFRVYNREAMRLLASPEATLLDYQDVGVLTLLHHRGLRICEVPAAMQERRSGHSRVFSTWRAVSYYLAYTGILSLSKWRPARRPLSPHPDQQNPARPPLDS